MIIQLAKMMVHHQLDVLSYEDKVDTTETQLGDAQENVDDPSAKEQLVTDDSTSS